MYKALSDKAEITLWYESPSSEEPISKCSRKRKADDSGDSGGRNLLIRLYKHYEKHGEDYNVSQYRMWARMKHNGQYTSLDEAPPYPLYNDCPKKLLAKRESALTEALTSYTNVVASAIAPEINFLGWYGSVIHAKFAVKTLYFLQKAHVCVFLFTWDCGPC
jgi:hypothetical protein